jgi:hypothetical protein
MNIENIEQLRALYGYPKGRAKDKVLQALDKHAVNFIKTSPFLIMSTVSAEGQMDASPRGGQAGFVKIIDKNTIIIPDSKGNNRLDSLSNIIETESVGMIFLIPGVDETLRINGKAQISTSPEYLSLFKSENNLPKVCIVVSIEELFLHCAKALMRSKLWHEDSKIERSSFPTMGKMLNEQLGIKDQVETQEEMVERYYKDL